jgi:hypothetical protein
MDLKILNAVASIHINSMILVRKIVKIALVKCLLLRGLVPVASNLAITKQCHRARTKRQQREKL